ncbi:MAG: tyrosine--tRNA ligase [Oscillospiraceae bacterium]|nr:tyrosine--tRNA ligase [Oscillospiraceae bacterium]
MPGVYDTLLERGYIAQATHEEDVRHLLNEGKTTYYVGFDPTADSLHVGHFLPIMVMAHLQRAGHRPIALIGGGTTMVGDPSDRTDMRKMLSADEISKNADIFKEQLSKFLDFSEGKAIMIDNAEWLMKLNYVDFLREIGVHFSVNRMLTAECYRSRMEKGLSFIEFNYMIMQSYDFLELHNRFGCSLQIGGDDQWSNILSGVDLIRRMKGNDAYGLTLNLLTTKEGVKMGKTQKGALWIDANKTSPYEFYQYWRNVHDDDVINCLKLLTFLPMERINEYAALKGEQLNGAKQLLAYELTDIVHGRDAAGKAAELAGALFGSGSNTENLTTTHLTANDIVSGLAIIDLLYMCKIAPSKSEARRLITQGGIYVNGEQVKAIDFLITESSFIEGELLLKKGKKTYHKVIISQ